MATRYAIAVRIAAFASAMAVAPLAAFAVSSTPAAPGQGQAQAPQPQGTDNTIHDHQGMVTSVAPGGKSVTLDRDWTFLVPPDMDINGIHGQVDVQYQMDRNGRKIMTAWHEENGP